MVGSAKADRERRGGWGAQGMLADVWRVTLSSKGLLCETGRSSDLFGFICLDAVYVHFQARHRALGGP